MLLSGFLFEMKYSENDIIYIAQIYKKILVKNIN